MYQPNFLEAETKLQKAVSFCDAHPGLRSSQTYRALLQKTLHAFRFVTRETDELHTRWRLALGDQLRRFKHARLSYDEVVELCDEHGLDDVPRRKIVYTEPDHLKALLSDTIAYLETKESEWDWIPPLILRLKSHLSEAAAQRKATETLYREYTVVVKRRVAAFEDVVAVLKEYLKDSRSEASELEGYGSFQLRID